MRLVDIDHPQRQSIATHHAGLARGDDQVTRCEALENLHLARLPHAELGFETLRHERWPCAVVRCRGRTNSRRHRLDQVLLAALRHECFFRHHQCAFANSEDDACPREHARLQLHARLIDTRAHQQRAAVGIDQRIERFDLADQRLAGQRIERDLHTLTDLRPAGEALRQAEIDPHARSVFEADEVSAVFDVVAEGDAADADHGVERRHDGQLGELCARQRNLCFSDFECGGVLIHSALADEVLCLQLAAALQVGARDARLRRRLFELRVLQRVVELHQQLALAHTPAIGEAELGDAPADLGPQDDGLNGTQAADGLGIVFDAQHFDLADFDDCRAATTAATWTRGTRRAAQCDTRAGCCTHLFRPDSAPRALEPPCRDAHRDDAEHRHHGVQFFHCHTANVAFACHP